MSRFRQYAPGEYKGERVDYSTAALRRALIGKRIGFDTKQSCMLGYGRVTDASGRNIEIDHNWYYVNDITQIVVLADQT